MPGTRAQGKSVADTIWGGSSAAVTAAQNLITVPYVATFNGRIQAVKVYGGTAGTGGGNTVCDVTVNGTSIWSQAAAKPTLLATATGEFNNAIGDRGSFKAGDRINLLVSSISSTGQAALSMTVALGAA
jgi:hypothetical protein